jgi:hypothetical protein
MFSLLNAMGDVGMTLNERMMSFVFHFNDVREELPSGSVSDLAEIKKELTYLRRTVEQRFNDQMKAIEARGGPDRVPGLGLKQSTSMRKAVEDCYVLQMRPRPVQV